MPNEIRVSKFEFVRNASKYLKGSTVVITHFGEDFLLLAPVARAGRAAATQPVAPEPIPDDDLSLHSCGCKKKEGKYLCETHGRF